MTKKEFPLEDVLSVVTGKLLSPSTTSHLYSILEFMTGDDVPAHQISHVMSECRHYLIKKYGLNVELSDFEDKENWLKKQIRIFGKKLLVEALPKKGVHEENQHEALFEIKNRPPRR